MEINYHDRPCVTDKEWDKMTLEEKVEALGKWAVLVTDYLCKVEKFKMTTKDVAGKIEDALQDVVSKMNGAGPPPKHPKDPNC